LDLFRGDRARIERWRFADQKARMKDFAPVKVREALDARDGFTSKKRFEMYEMFSELAGHPNMNSHLMMRRPFRRAAGAASDIQGGLRAYGPQANFPTLCLARERAGNGAEIGPVPNGAKAN
jgi:hypothetical protein